MNSIVSEKRYIANKLGVPYESLSQSYLRAETELGTQSVIDFTLQTNKVLAPTVTERLLDLNDEFVITHFRVGLKPVQVNPNAGLSEAKSQQDTQVETYSPLNYTGLFGTVTGNKMFGQGAIYNSDLNFTIDRTEFIPNFPVRAFYRVPDILNTRRLNTQTFPESTSGVPTNLEPSTTNVAKGGLYIAQTETSLYGFYPSEPTKIDGRQTIDLSINLGANVDMSAIDPLGLSKNYAVFEARGYLITNAND